MRGVDGPGSDEENAVPNKLCARRLLGATFLRKNVVEVFRGRVHNLCCPYT